MKPIQKRLCMLSKQQEIMNNLVLKKKLWGCVFSKKNKQIYLNCMFLKKIFNTSLR